MVKTESKICQNCKKDFVIELEDFNFYEKIKVPPPTFCPECRIVRRFIWRNERTLYHNKCAFSGKPIITMFAPETNLVVYDRDIWWGDKWDPLAYGQDYDFPKPFFEQFSELLHRVPLMNLGNSNCVNSDYGNHNEGCRNCYLTFAAYSNENVSYSTGVFESKDSIDLYKVGKSEQCYEDVLCNALFNTHFSYDSDECIDSYFLTSCLNLQNCLGCMNLRHKKHCIFNKQYTKEEYDKERAKYDFGSHEALERFKKEYKNFIKNQFRRFAFIYKSKDVTGDNVMFSKNSKMVFDIFSEAENSKYIIHGAAGIKECYDGYGIGAKAEEGYEIFDTGIQGYRQMFSIINHTCQEAQYTYMCFLTSMIDDREHLPITLNPCIEYLIALLRFSANAVTIVALFNASRSVNYIFGIFRLTENIKNHFAVLGKHHVVPGNVFGFIDKSKTPELILDKIFIFFFESFQYLITPEVIFSAFFIVFFFRILLVEYAMLFMP